MKKVAAAISAVLLGAGAIAGAIAAGVAWRKRS